MKYRFESMEDPLCMAHMQARIDAEFHRRYGIPFEESVAQTIDRMRYLFGDDVPARLVYSAVRRAYRYRAREEEAK
jgi:hypothetical protein